jgi:hypothetical protein
MQNSIFRWIARCTMVSVLLILFGCSSSSNKGYTLTAQLPPSSKTQLIMMATIDVEGSTCNVNVMTWSTNNPWRPSCTVNQDQPTHKNFTIDGQQVDLVAVNDGFKLSGASSLTVPLPASTTAPAATAKTVVQAGSKSKAGAKQEKTATPQVAANAKKAPTSAASSSTSTATAAAATPPGQAFPTLWKVSLFPGHHKLVAQNLGYLVKSASINIDGSTCVLDVTFKVRYPPYNLECAVTTDKRGDFTLLFNPFKVAKAASSATNSIQMDSEGASISGTIWDSHGFDSWTPSVPPSWRVRTAADN